MLVRISSPVGLAISVMLLIREKPPVDPEGCAEALVRRFADCGPQHVTVLSRELLIVRIREGVGGRSNCLLLILGDVVQKAA